MVVITAADLPDNASPMLVMALTVRFLLELTLLVGVAVLAWSLTTDGWRWSAAIVAVAAVATAWGLFLSPKAAIPLPGLAILAIEAALFLGTGVGLLHAGLGVPAAIGCAVRILDRIAIALLQH